MTNICIRAIVSGRVQGVWFRKFTQRAALQKNLSGWAKNLSNGDVEVLLCGERESVELVLQSIHQGPPNAVVNTVDYSEVPWQALNDFTTG